MLIWNVFTQVLLPILLMFAAGWALDRRWNLDLGTVVKLNLNLFVPAFIFYELLTTRLTGLDALKAIGFTVSVVAILFVLAAVVARCCRYSHEQTRSLQIASIFYNSANYGDRRKRYKCSSSWCKTSGISRWGSFWCRRPRPRVGGHWRRFSGRRACGR
jgi:predicted permease